MKAGASVAANQLEFNHYMAHRPLCQCCQPPNCCEVLIRLHREWRSNNEELVILSGCTDALNPIPTRLFWVWKPGGGGGGASLVGRGAKAVSWLGFYDALYLSVQVGFNRHFQVIKLNKIFRCAKLLLAWRHPNGLYFNLNLKKLGEGNTFPLLFSFFLKNVSSPLFFSRNEEVLSEHIFGLSSLGLRSRETEQWIL